MTGDVTDLAAEREARHVPGPRDGEQLYRHGVPVLRVPRPADYPLTSICTCGKTIDRPSADGSWAHREWADDR